MNTNRNLFSCALLSLPYILLLFLFSPQCLAATSCDSPVRSEDVELVFRDLPLRIVGFEHLEVLEVLETQRARLLCLHEAIPPRLLARLFFYSGLARLYALSEREVGPIRPDSVVLENFGATIVVDPFLKWDSSTLGPFGRDIWLDLHRNPARRFAVRMPHEDPTVTLWVDGRLAGRDDLWLDLLPGFHLIQLRTSKGWSAFWWKLEAVEGEVLPLADGKSGREANGKALEGENGGKADGNDALEQARRGRASEGNLGEGVSASGSSARRHAEARISLGIWSIPLVYAGPSLGLRVPLGRSMELTIEAAMAAGPGFDGDKWILPLRMGGGFRLERVPLKPILGLEYQLFAGGGFGASGSVFGASAAPEIAEGWSFDGKKWWGTEAPVAHACGVSLEVAPSFGQWSLLVKGGLGLVLWPGTLLEPQENLSVGLGRVLGKRK